LFYVNKVTIGKLPFIILNLTKNKFIDIEIKLKKLPLINFNSFSIHLNYDYFLENKLNIFKNNIDNIYYFIFLLKYINKFKNV
jgi:hypothetical protein